MTVYTKSISTKRIFVSIFFGMMFSTFGLPGVSRIISPDVLGLVLFYWAMVGGDARPKLGTAFVLGCIVDILSGQIVGLHSLKYLVLVLVSMQFDNRFRMSTSLHNITFVMITFFLVELILSGLLSSYMSTPFLTDKVIAAAVWGLSWPLMGFLIQKDYSRVVVK